MIETTTSSSTHCVVEYVDDDSTLESENEAINARDGREKSTFARREAFNPASLSAVKAKNQDLSVRKVGKSTILSGN